MRNRPSPHFFEPQEARRDLLLVRLRASEKRALRDEAERRGISLSELIRRQILCMIEKAEPVGVILTIEK